MKGNQNFPHDAGTSFTFYSTPTKSYHLSTVLQPKLGDKSLLLVHQLRKNFNNEG